MKKLSILFFSFLMLIILSSCDLFKPKIQKTIEKLNEAKSFSIRMVSLDPKYEDEEIIIEVDNDKCYFFFEDIEYYINIENDTTFIYLKLNDKWYKATSSILEMFAEVSIDFTDYKDLALIDFNELDFDWFEKDGDIYILKDEFLQEALELDADELEQVLEELDTITLEIDEDSLIITINLKEEYGIKMYISEIGDTEVVLPEAETLLE